jgi:hypothetical protein
MARSVVYFYPTSDVPITAANVVAAIDSCKVDYSDEERRERFTVKAFLSVPYILSVLAADNGGMDMLKAMDLVSTGGAPLDADVGATMAKQGVRLVSRLGSSECGCKSYM